MRGRWKAGVALVVVLLAGPHGARGAPQGVTPAGQGLLAAAALPGYRVEVASVYLDAFRFYPSLGPSAWDIYMRAAADVLQSPGGQLPLHRLSWSLLRHPSGTVVVPPTPLGPGEIHVARGEWDAAYEMRWWFEPAWGDRPTAEPYSVPILYTVVVGDVDARAVPYLAYPNPFAPGGEPFRLLVRYGSWEHDAQVGSFTAILIVSPADRPFDSGGPPPFCTRPAVYSAYVPISLRDRSGPPWVHPDWFELVWDGRDSAGQPVAPGDYCVDVVFSPPGVFAVQVPLRVRPPSQEAASLQVQVVDATTGRRLPGASISLGPAQGPPGRTVLAGPDGSALFSGLPAGFYRVSAGAPGFRSQQRQVRLVAPAGPEGSQEPGQPHRLTLALEAASVAEVEVRLQTPHGGSARAGDLVEVEVRLILPSSGAGVRSGSVELMLPENLRALAGSADGRPLSDLDGRRLRWSLETLGAGQSLAWRVVAAVVPLPAIGSRQRVRAVARLYPQPADPRGDVGPEAVTAASEAELSVQPAGWAQSGTVMGRVIGPDGQAVEGAVVQTHDGRRVRTGMGGWFSLELPAGPHLLQVATVDGSPPAASALVHVRPQSAHGLVLTAGYPGAASPWVAAAGQVEWGSGPQTAAGAGVALYTPVPGGSAWAALRLEGETISLPRAELVSGPWRLTVSDDPGELLDRLGELAPDGPGQASTLVVEPPVEVAGELPVVLATWDGATPGTRVALMAGGDGQGPDRPSLWAAAWREDAGGQAWWAAGLHGAAGEHEGPRVRWEAGRGRQGQGSGHRWRLAADGPLTGPLAPDAAAVQVEAWGPVEDGGSQTDVAGLRLDHAWGRDAATLLAESVDPLDELVQTAIAYAGPGPGSRQEQTHLVLTPSVRWSWGLRRWTHWPSSGGSQPTAVADGYTVLTFAPAGPTPPATGEPPAGPWQPVPGLPSLRLRLGLLSAQGPGVGAGDPGRQPGASRWRPYGGLAAVWPSVGTWPGWRTELGLSGVLVQEAYPPPEAVDLEAVPSEGPWSGRAGLWVQTQGHPLPGVDLKLRLAWEGAPGSGLAQARPDGWSLRAQLTPLRPMTLSLGMRSVPGAVRWEEAALSIRRSPLYLKLRADADDVGLSLELTPRTGPWFARLQVEGARAGQSPWSLTADGAYLASRWAAALQAAAQPSETSLQLWWEARRAQAMSLKSGSPVPAQAQAREAVPSVHLAWRQVTAFGTRLDTFVVQPALSVALGGPWAVVLDGMVAVQSTPGGEGYGYGWVSAALGYTLPVGPAGLRAEVGYRARVAGPASSLAGEGWFVRLGGWGTWLPGPTEEPPPGNEA